MKRTTKETIHIKDHDVTYEHEESIETFGIVPIGLSSEDSMERIAVLQDQFSKTMDPILCMYNAAMNETTARLEMIKDESRFCGKRCPIHHIDTRLKSVKSILGKLQKKDLELSLTTACNNIYDIAGVRVVCPYVKDIYTIRDRIEAQNDILIMEEKDYVKTPKKNGYRSLHMIIRVPIYFMSKRQLVPVELQIRSLAMDLWASLEHDLKYKNLHKESGIDFTAKLYECSHLIYQAEAEMEKIDDVLEGEKERMSGL